MFFLFVTKELVIWGGAAVRDLLAQKLLQEFDAGTERQMRFQAVPAKMPERWEKACKGYKRDYYESHLGITDGVELRVCSADSSR
eukprot:715094-Amphidinium_carterae.1